MGLFQFIKNLFAKADAFETQIETQVESFVADVKKTDAKLASEITTGVTKVKKVKADAEAKVAEVEAKVKKATAKKPKATATKKTK